jgi:hypothetical protein
LGMLFSPILCTCPNQCNLCIHFFIIYEFLEGASEYLLQVISNV